MKRKDVGKRQGGILSRIGKAILGTPVPSAQEAYNSDGHTVTNWSHHYDATPLGGDRIVGGKHCKTAGEFKAACVKFYGPECSG